MSSHLLPVQSILDAIDVLIAEVEINADEEVRKDIPRAAIVRGRSVGVPLLTLLRQRVMELPGQDCPPPVPEEEVLLSSEGASTPAVTIGHTELEERGGTD